MLKKETNVTYEEIRDQYEHFRARCATPKRRRKRKRKKKAMSKRKGKDHQSGGRVSLIKGKGKRSESGCTKSRYGLKSMSVIHIVPKKEGVNAMKIDPRCRIK
tara:strand:+ start:54 stop:362 length:309 start_codon:yes stop_codon:yes gene_type:complete